MSSRVLQFCPLCDDEFTMEHGCFNPKPLFTEMTDDKAKARGMALQFSNDFSRLDEFLPIPREAIDPGKWVGFMAGYLALQSEMTLWKERAIELDRKNDMNGLHIANLEKERDGLSERLKEAESVIRKYKNIAWATGSTMTREESMAAQTYLSKTPKKED